MQKKCIFSAVDLYDVIYIHAYAELRDLKKHAELRVTFLQRTCPVLLLQLLQIIKVAPKI